MNPPSPEVCFANARTPDSRRRSVRSLYFLGLAIRFTSLLGTWMAPGNVPFPGDPISLDLPEVNPGKPKVSCRETLGPATWREGIFKLLFC